MKNQPNDPAHHLRVSFLTNSTKSSKKVEILLCGRDKISTDKLFRKLSTAVALGVEQMYEYDAQSKPLGVGEFPTGLLSDLFLGRYARVVRAINRHLRDVITHSHSNLSLQSQLEKGNDNGSAATSVPTVGQCAIKLVNKTEFWNQVKNGSERKDTLAREVLAQSHILNSLVQSGHNGNSFNSGYNEVNVSELELPIVILNGILETRDEFVMDMELMHSGDLYEKLVEHGTSFKEIQVKHIAIQLVQAVALCQANGIAHRDIKLSNITFPEKVHQEFLNDHSKHKPMQIKLADFGMAGFVNKEGYLWGRCGTPGGVIILE